MQDSSKAIQEKFALTRELERLRPEMEHLKSQLANYQSMVAEKNDLRRQLDSLEVELENEKRSRERAQLKEDDAAMAGLKSRLEKAEKKLAADGKEREKAKTELERKLAEAQAFGERLEERVESLKAKYKASQGELKETRSRLEACQAELQSAKKTAKETAAKKSVTIESGLNRKRRAQEMSYDDITIQTPGNQEMASKRPAARKRGMEQAVVGEKSTFSITPFLKRTKNLSDESLEASANETLDGAGPDSTLAYQEDGTGASEVVAKSEAEDNGSDPAAETEAAPKRKVQTKAPSKAAPRPRGRPRTKGLAEASPAEANKVIGKAERAPATKARAALGTVTEVPAAEEQENASSKAPAPQAKGPEGDAKKKKRKLLGAASQALLGDEEGETAAVKVPAKPVLVPSKKARLQLGGVPGVKTNAFAAAAFSPLKRDRRGVNASFLA